MWDKHEPLEQRHLRDAGEQQAREDMERRVQQASEAASGETPERVFKDRAQRDMILRVNGPRPDEIPDAQPGASLETKRFFQLRAYDAAAANASGAAKGAGEAGRANLTIEVSRDVDGNVTGRRLRVNDFKVNDRYQNSGIGGEMLEDIKQIGREHHAQEIYGAYVPDQGKEAVTRHVYEKHGFGFRNGSNGDEVWMTLPKDDDVGAFRRELGV